MKTRVRRQMLMVACGVGATCIAVLLVRSNEADNKPAASGNADVQVPSFGAASIASKSSSPVQAIGPSSLHVRLAGVGTGADSKPLAIVSINQSVETLVRVGEAISPKARVVAIDSVSMTYMLNGAAYRVYVQLAPMHDGDQSNLEPADRGKSVSTKGVAPQFPGFIKEGDSMPTTDQAGSSLNGNATFRAAMERKAQSLIVRSD